MVKEDRKSAGVREEGGRGGQGQTEADDCLPRALEGGNPKKKKTKDVDISGGGCSSVH